MPKFPRAAGAEFHRRRGLKYQRFVLEAGRLTSTCCQDAALSEGSREGSILASCQRLWVGTHFLVHANVCICPRSVTSLCVFGY